MDPHPTLTPLPPSAAALVPAEFGARMAPRRPRALGLGASWVISGLVHLVLLLVAATWFVAQPTETAARAEREQAVTRLDLRATPLVEKARRQPTFEARADPRAGIPEPAAEAFVPPEQPARDRYEDLQRETLVTPLDAETQTGGSSARDAALASLARNLARPTRLPAPSPTSRGAGEGSDGAGQASGNAGGQEGVGAGAGTGTGATAGSVGPLGAPGGTGQEATAAVPPDEPPVLLSGPEPVYPPISRRAGEEGRVECRLTIDETGLVVQVEILTSSGFVRLDESACQALESWRFRPATHRGVAVRCAIEHGVTFRLVRSQR